MNFELLFAALGLGCFGVNSLAWRAYGASQNWHAKPTAALAALAWIGMAASLCLSVLSLLGQVPGAWTPIAVGTFLVIQYGGSAWLHCARRDTGRNARA